MAIVPMTVSNQLTEMQFVTYNNFVDEGVPLAVAKDIKAAGLPEFRRACRRCFNWLGVNTTWVIDNEFFPEDGDSVSRTRDKIDATWSLSTPPV